MKNILEINKINKKYTNFELKNVSINIPYGKVVGFIGENGSGKTTTIKSILKLINIDSGNINIFGKELNEETLEKIGIVLDNSFFFEGLTPKEINIVMSKTYKNWDKQYYIEQLTKFNLQLNKPIKDFSTGMLVKLKIITALSYHPNLLILDEPTSGLDPIARNEILELFKDFISNKENSIFISSHITSDLESIADNIIFINKGQIVLDEEKNYILNNYKIIKINDLEKIDKKIIIKKLKKDNDYLILVNKKDINNKKYKEEKVTLDEIMLLYVKGE